MDQFVVRQLPGLYAKSLEYSRTVYPESPVVKFIWEVCDLWAGFTLRASRIVHAQGYLAPTQEHWMNDTWVAAHQLVKPEFESVDVAYLNYVCKNIWWKFIEEKILLRESE